MESQRNISLWVDLKCKWNRVTWLGLEPTVVYLRSHTWFQDLLKLRFLMSHRRKNLMRDKVMGKKCLSLERETLDRQSVGHLRGRERPWNTVWLLFMGWVVSWVNVLANYSFWEEAEIHGNWACPLFGVWWSASEPSWRLVGVSLSWCIAVTSQVAQR